MKFVLVLFTMCLGALSLIGVSLVTMAAAVWISSLSEHLAYIVAMAWISLWSIAFAVFAVILFNRDGKK